MKEMRHLQIENIRSYCLFKMNFKMLIVMHTITVTAG